MKLLLLAVWTLWLPLVNGPIPTFQAPSVQPLVIVAEVEDALYVQVEVVNRTSRRLFDVALVVTFTDRGEVVSTARYPLPNIPPDFGAGRTVIVAWPVVWDEYTAAVEWAAHRFTGVRIGERPSSMFEEDKRD